MSQKISIKVKPNAKQSVLTELEDGTYAAQLKAPPVDGKANKALIDLVAKHFAVRKSQVSIKNGLSGRQKLVIIDD